MRVLISAYACEPGRGSEPEVGLQAVLAAAEQHEVWVVTRENNLPSLGRFLENHPRRARIHPVGLDVPGAALRFKKRTGMAGMHWYYDLWQRRLADVAVRLDREVGFDVVHHVTFANYWTRTGVAAVDKPLVWGPVGGGTRPPLGLLPILGVRGALGGVSRVLARPLASRLHRARRTARRARVVLVQNPETAHRLGMEGTATVLPNALAAVPLVVRGSAGVAGAEPRAVTAGRLIGFKGTCLAMAAVRLAGNAGLTLDVYGAGPQRARLLRLRDWWGLAERVRFRGEVPRQELLSALAGAAVLVHPSLHEEAGFVVVEALAAGTPVVALDRGGPPAIARFFPGVPARMVKPSTPWRTARRLAAAIDSLIGSRGVPAAADGHFADGILAAYEAAGRASGD